MGRSDVQDTVTAPPRVPIQERRVDGLSGFPLLGGAVGAATTGVALLIAVGGRPGHILGVLVVFLALLTLRGLITVEPGNARVILLFGDYRGTVRTPGLRWVNPLTRRPTISTRIRNHESTTAKVNDADGIPIDIAAVVVWQVTDTAQACFAVEDFVAFAGSGRDGGAARRAHAIPRRARQRSAQLARHRRDY